MLSSPVRRSLRSKRRRVIGISPDACRLLDESAAAGHKLLTSPWAVATARSNLEREPQADQHCWRQAQRPVYRRPRPPPVPRQRTG